MVPYYKLNKHWFSEAQHFIIFGAPGLIKTELFNKITTHRKLKPRTHMIQTANDCQTIREQLASQSLFSEPELLIIRVPSDALLKSLALPSYPNADRTLIIDAPDSKKHNIPWIKAYTDADALCIRTFPLKDHQKPMAIKTLLSQEHLTLSSQAIQWLILSHQGQEYLLPMTIKRIALTFGAQSISDQDIRGLLFNQAQVSPFEAIDSMLSNSHHLELFSRVASKEDWAKTYWILLSFWRKVALSATSPTQIKTHFPWESQAKQARQILSKLSSQQIQKRLMSLIKIEIHMKGLGIEPYPILIQQWMRHTQQSLSS